MTITTTSFGEFQGKRVDAFTLKSDTGVEVDIIGYGVVVRDWRVPVNGGAARGVVLGFEDFDAYPAHSPHFGSHAGRVANRISGGSFELDGKTYALATNEGGNTLHGGPEGLGRQVWDGEVDTAQNAVHFTLHSPDGAMGFPGNVDFTAVGALHQLTAGHTFHVDCHMRMSAGEAGEDDGEEEFGIVIRRSETHRACNVRLGESGHGFIAQRHNTAGIVDEFFTIAGEFGASAIF